MTRSNFLAPALLAAGLAAGLAAPGFAATAAPATTISVTETGEAAGPMGLTLEPSSVKAGPADFTVKNGATTSDHEMVVVRLKSADQKIPLNTNKHRVNEKKLKSIGEVEDLKPGATGELKADLKPGTYLVFCNYKGHYEAGMQAKLTVTP